MEKWWRAFRCSNVSTPPHVVVNHKLNGYYGWSFDTICSVFAGHVSTARVDLDGLQPRIRILVWTVLQCSLVVIRADRHNHVLAEDVIRRLGHIRKPKDQRTVDNGWLPPHIFLSVFNISACKRLVILAHGFELLVGEVGSKGDGSHVFQARLD